MFATQRQVVIDVRPLRALFEALEVKAEVGDKTCGVSMEISVFGYPGVRLLVYVLAPELPWRLGTIPSAYGARTKISTCEVTYVL